MKIKDFFMLVVEGAKEAEHLGLTKGEKGR